MLPKLLYKLFYKNEILLKNKIFIQKLNEIFTIWKEKFNLFENNFYNGLFYYSKEFHFYKTNHVIILVINFVVKFYKSKNILFWY